MNRNINHSTYNYLLCKFCKVNSKQIPVPVLEITEKNRNVLRDKIVSINVSVEKTAVVPVEVISVGI